MTVRFLKVALAVSGLAIGSGAIGSAGSAQAGVVHAVLDFNSATTGSYTNLIVGDFQFNAIGFGDNPTVRDLGGGNRALVDGNPNNSLGAWSTMSRIDGGTFTVTQFDLLNLNGGSGFFRVDFAGPSYTAAGTYFVSTAGNVGINIVSAVGFGGADYAVDNIHVTYEAPAPGALVLLGFGLIGLGLRRTRTA